MHLNSINYKNNIDNTVNFLEGSKNMLIEKVTNFTNYKNNIILVIDNIIGYLKFCSGMKFMYSSSLAIILVTIIGVLLKFIFTSKQNFTNKSYLNILFHFGWFLG